MTGLGIELLAATTQDEIRAEFDSQSGLLSLRSESNDKWPRALNVDDLVILDCSQSGVVRNVELLIPESRWAILASDEFPPLVGPSNALKLLDEELSRMSIDLPVAVSRSGTTVVMSFVAQDEEPSGGSLVKLSPTCAARVSNSRLIGLIARIIDHAESGSHA